jgi:hypothetical protein
MVLPGEGGEGRSGAELLAGIGTRRRLAQGAAEGDAGHEREPDEQTRPGARKGRGVGHHGTGVLVAQVGGRVVQTARRAARVACEPARAVLVEACGGRLQGPDHGFGLIGRAGGPLVDAGRGPGADAAGGAMVAG